MLIQILGLVAGGIIVFSSLPQIVKIIRSKKTADISFQTYLLLSIGVFLWVVYGLTTNQIAILLPNVIFLIFNLIILYLKIRHG